MNKVNALSKDYKNNEFDMLLDDSPLPKTIVKRHLPPKEDSAKLSEVFHEPNRAAPTQRQTIDDRETEMDDIVIQRKKKNQAQIMVIQEVPKEDTNREGDDNNTSSIMEEENEAPVSPSKLNVLKPIDSKPESLGSQPRSMNVSMNEFKNSKKITSLDELYVQNNFFSKNMKNPYQETPINFQSEGFVVEVFEARYLPDTVNFVRVKGMIYGINSGIEGKVHKGTMLIDGDINSVLLDFVLKVESLSSTDYDDLYVFLIWETFQDIFGEEDVEFMPLVFGFSLVKLFTAEGKKSLSTCVVDNHLEMASLRGTAANRYLPSKLFEARTLGTHSHVPVIRHNADAKSSRG